MLAKQEYERWRAYPALDEESAKELAEIENSPELIELRFGSSMSFGTAGLRSTMYAGTACMNVYTVAQATQGLAVLVKQEKGAARGVAIAYDSRNNSALFARVAAEVLTANGIHVYLFDGVRPTPELSFAVRECGCIAGINITASHNPSEYNGYKAYWEDGGQLPPDHAATVAAEIASVDIFRDVPAPDKADASLITITDSSLDERYMEKVLEQAVNPDAIAQVADEMAIVYTPLHGTGATMVPQLLKKAGLTKLYTVDEQMLPDGNFPTVKFPNPEFPQAFDLGRIIADRVGSDLIVATDPDADRVGVMAKDKNGEFKCITGNQMGALLLEYIATAFENTGKMPSEPYAVKTIVTTELCSRICEAHGVHLYNVLTGFKFIGEVIKNHEIAGHGTFLLGFEESYGYLKGTYARDKDAVVASLLICEMAAYYKTRNMTLIDALDEIFEKYGYFRESVISISMDGLDGAERMAAMMSGLRKNPPSEIGGKKVAIFKDFLEEKTVDFRSGAAYGTGLPKSDVLYYLMEDDNLVVVRPSGTEPKVKVYILANGKDDADAQANAEACIAGARKLIEG